LGLLVGLTLDDLRRLPSGLPESDPVFQTLRRPYLVTRRWVYEKYWTWGEKSALWQARVRGQFPEQAEDSLFSLAWLEAAKNRPGADDPKVKLAVGIDVGGPGEDETVVTIRGGGSILVQKTWPQQDPRGEVAAFLAPYRRRIDEVNIDSAGIGHYFAKHFEDLGYKVNFVNVGEALSDSEHYSNLKAELYWGLRQRFENGDVAGLLDEVTISQLAAIRYRHNARGQVMIESKDEARKRGVKSPDRAESLLLAFADRTPAIIRYYKEEVKRRSAADASDNPAAPGKESSAESNVDDLVRTYEEALRELQEEYREESSFNWRHW
jgi:phage terminase large subunit